MSTNKGFTLWLTGLSGAGKTTLAALLANKLCARGIGLEVLDGDEVRTNLSRGLGFSKEDRDTNIRRIGYVCRLLSRNGVATVAAAISPYRMVREEVRRASELDGVEFVEVYVKCPIEVLAERDVKGLYKKALAGEIKEFTGVSDPYEEPLTPDVIVETDRESVEFSAGKIISRLEKRGLIPANGYNSGAVSAPVKQPIQPTTEADFIFGDDEPFRLAAGGTLQPLTLRYATYGKLNEARDNALLVCHALSGSARAADWWPQLVGPERPFDTNRYCVIGVNAIGSCYGSTGPRSPQPQKPHEPYGIDFPLISIRDIVRTQARLLDHLGVVRLKAVVGGSIGGMQALDWAIEFPERVERCIAIGATPLSAMGLALNHLQRQAIRNDPDWLDGGYTNERPPTSGLALARAIALCTYKSPELFTERFARRPDRSGEDPYGSLDARYDIAGYLDYQGSIFTSRFDANSYLVLSKAMDTFDLARGQWSEVEALGQIRARLLLVGISSDWLFPAEQVRQLAEAAIAAGANAKYAELETSHGHDGFLADAELLAPIIRSHLEEVELPFGLSAGRVANVETPFNPRWETQGVILDRN